MDAFRESGTPRLSLETGIDEARARIDALGEAGIDLDEITADLERDGVKQFADAYDKMIEAIAAKREHVAA